MKRSRGDESYQTCHLSVEDVRNSGWKLLWHVKMQHSAASWENFHVRVWIWMTWLHPETFVESVTHFFPSSDWLVSLTVISISTQHVISMSGRQLHSLHCPQINLYLYWKHFRSTQRLFSVVLGLSRLRQFQGENPTSSVLWAKDR